MKMPNKPDLGWSERTIYFQGCNKPIHICTYEKPAKLGFVNPQTNEPYSNVSNGDAVRIRKIDDRLRISVFDGVTGTPQDDLPDGFTNPAVYAKEKAAELVAQAPELNNALIELNSLLHDPKKATLSPNVCVSVADIRFTSETMSATFTRAGDCEIYVHTTEEGWTEILPEDMLTQMGRFLYEELKKKCLPEINRIREKLGMESEEFKQLYIAFAESEEEILGDPSNWRSLPIGRYSTPILKHSGLMTVDETEIDAIFATSDGPHTSDREPFTEILNKFEHPSDIGSDFFESRREGWNDMAAGIVSFAR